MKNRLVALVKGELSRLNKYNVFSISILVAVIWGVILFLVNEDILRNVLPFVLIIDATMMSVMYIGAVMYFEKNESTISTMLVTPSSNNELVASKVIANIIHNSFASSLIIVVFVIFKDVDLNIPLVFLGLISATSFFTISGLCLSYFQKDFMGMLLTVMVLAFVLMIPSMLYMFDVITGDFWEYFLLINPVQAAQEIIGGAFRVPNESGAMVLDLSYRYYISLGYMVIGAILLYTLFAIPKFQNYAIKQSGV